jgi:hypothetical protein
MDLCCARCGEPWDMDHVLHEEPQDFKYKDGRISECPACRGKSDKDLNLSPGQKNRADIAGVLADLLGDDVDGIAAEMADLGM